MEQGRWKIDSAVVWKWFFPHGLSYIVVSYRVKKHESEVGG